MAPHLSTHVSIPTTSMSACGLLNNAGDVAYQLLRLTAASLDVFPPLESVVLSALYITDIVKIQPSCSVLDACCPDFTWQGFHAQKAEWNKFSDYMQKVVASVIGSLTHTTASKQDIEKKLNNLNGEVFLSLWLYFCLIFRKSAGYWTRSPRRLQLIITYHIFNEPCCTSRCLI